MAGLGINLALFVGGNASASIDPRALRSGSQAATLDIDPTENFALSNGSEALITDFLTSSRASSGFAETREGTLTLFGSNTLRRTNLGILTEGASTNLCLRSQDLTNAAWTPAGAVVSNQSITCPDGTSLCQRVLDDTSTGIHGIAPTSVLTNSAGLHTLTAYIRNSGTDFVAAGIWDGTKYQSGNFSFGGHGVGSLGEDVLGADMRMLSGPLGWWRLEITIENAPANTTFYIARGAPNIVFAADGRPSFAGTGSTGFYVWGAQFEPGFASSYIPTTSAPATRAADIISFSDTSWIGGTSDSIYVEHALTGRDYGYGRRGHSNGVILAIDGTNNVELRELLGTAPSTPTPLYTSIEATIAGATAAIPTPDAPWKVRTAARLTANNFGISLEGGAVATDVSEAAPGTVTAVRLGCDLAGGNHLNSYIRRISCFKDTALADAALSALEAPWIGTDIPGLSTKATTGSITGGSDQLTVADVTNFTVGQTVIVAIGGEVGAGQRGTVGVGGVWPTLSYANTAARDADTSQTPGRYAWLLDSGNVTYWQGTPASWALSSYYYYAKAIPQPLVATVLGIAGNVLTLGATAAVSSASAAVTVDNSAALQSGFITLPKAQIPPGAYEIANPLLLSKAYLDVRGSGEDLTEIRVPKGREMSGQYGTPAAVLMTYSRNAQFSGFTLRGNGGLHGYGLGLAGDLIGSTIVGPLIYGQGSPDASFKDIRIIDAVAQACVMTGGCHNTWAHDITVIQNSQQQEYAQWQMQWTQVFGGGFVNCAYDSDYFIPAFERFSSYGGVFHGITSRNGIIATNASGGFSMKDVSITMEEDCLRRPFPGSMGMIGCNNNTGGGVFTDQVRFENINLVCEGRVDTTGIYASGPQQNMFAQGIVLSVDFALVTIDGGSFTCPDYNAGLAYVNVGHGIICNTNPPVVYVTDFDCTGSPGPVYQNISLNTGRATNCTGSISIINPV